MAYGGGGFRRGGGGGGFRRSFDGPREMTKIKCSECGKDAEVPFKPREGTPVYCRECFMKRKGITPTPSAPVKKKEAKEDAEEEFEEEEEEEEFESE